MCVAMNQGVVFDAGSAVYLPASCLQTMKCSMHLQAGAVAGVPKCAQRQLQRWVHLLLLLGVFQEGHGQLLLLDQHCERVPDLHAAAPSDALARCMLLDPLLMSVQQGKYLGAHLVPEAVQLLLPYDTGVAEPPPVWLDSRAGELL